MVVDENIPRLTVTALRDRGHDVRDVRGTDFAGADDVDLWALAQREKRLLVSTDKGFTCHRMEHHHGILIIRLRQPNLARIHSRVMIALRGARPEKWLGRLLVVRDRVQSNWRMRYRKP